MAIEYIDWYDHSSNVERTWRTTNEWIDQQGAPIVIRTYGEVIWEDEERLMIVSETRRDSDLLKPLYRFETSIFKALIKERHKLVPESEEDSGQQKQE